MAMEMTPQKLLGYIIYWKPSGATMVLVKTPHKGRITQIRNRPRSMLKQHMERATLFRTLGLARDAVARTIRFYRLSCGDFPGLPGVRDLTEPENFCIVNVYSATVKPRNYCEEATTKDLLEKLKK